VWILAALLLPCYFASAYTFDHDTAQDCADRTKDCEKDKTTFFECPITCAQALEPPTESRASSGTLVDEDFYALQATDVNGKKIDFENYEGYITVIAALPKQKGELRGSGIPRFEWLMMQPSSHTTRLFFSRRPILL